MMNSEMQKQIDRLLALYSRVGIRVDLEPGHSESQIAQLESETGLTVPRSLRELYSLTNGVSKHFVEGNDELLVFAIEDFPEPDQLTFCGLNEARRHWGRLHGLKDTDTRGGAGNKDLLLVAHVLGGQNSVYVDGNGQNPATFGQIILVDYQMEVTVVADDFMGFFAASNSLLETMADEDSDFFRTWLIG